MIIALLFSSLVFAQPSPETPLKDALLSAKFVRAGAKEKIYSAQKTAFENQPVLFRASAQLGESGGWERAGCYLEIEDVEIGKAARAFLGADGRSLERTHWVSDMVIPSMPPYFSIADVVIRRDVRFAVDKGEVAQYRSSNRSCLRSHQESGYNADGEWYSWNVCDELGPVHSYSLSIHFSLTLPVEPSLNLSVACSLSSRSEDRSITLGDFEEAMGHALELGF